MCDCIGDAYRKVSAYYQSCDKFIDNLLMAYIDSLVYFCEKGEERVVESNQITT